MLQASHMRIFLNNCINVRLYFDKSTEHSNRIYDGKLISEDRRRVKQHATRIQNTFCCSDHTSTH
jgi:hypothetical protein